MIIFCCNMLDNYESWFNICNIYNYESWFTNYQMLDNYKMLDIFHLLIFELR